MRPPGKGSISNGTPLSLREKRSGRLVQPCVYNDKFQGPIFAPAVFYGFLMDIPPASGYVAGRPGIMQRSRSSI